MSLPGDPKADRARLQGWAILENFSGQAWHGVSLTLLSGNPVTFRQSLFESYYITRPNVPVEVVGRVLPKPDTGSERTQMLRRDHRFIVEAAHTQSQTTYRRIWAACPT